MPKIDAIKERARTVGEKITSQTFPIQERLEQLNKAKKEPAPPQDRYGGYTDSSRTSLQVNVAGGEEAKSLPPVEVTATQDQEQVLLPNPLHQYSSSTYSISLHMLTPQQYNSIVGGEKYVPQNVIIAGAGRWGDNFKRAPDFQEDFYFDNLRMNTVVGQTLRNRQSNMVDCTFTVIEPLGFTFINRLVTMSTRIGNRDWVQDPYMLQIDFYSSDIPGIIPGTTKYLPVSLVQIKSRLTARGAEYTVHAVPYHHRALSEIEMSIPTDMTIKGETVKDYLGFGSAPAGKNKKPTPSSETYKTTASPDRKISEPGGNFKFNGIIENINKYHQTIRAEEKDDHPNEYRIVIDQEIGDSSAFPNIKNTPNAAQAPTDAAAKKAGTQSATGKNYDKLSFEAGQIVISKGAKLDEAIALIINNSEYVRSQVIDYQEISDTTDITRIAPESDNAFKHFRILPRLTITGWSRARKSYSYLIEYHIVKWKKHSSHPLTLNAGQVMGYVKQYNYIFTGENDDVLDLSMDFNMAYLNTISIADGRFFNVTNSEGSFERKYAAENKDVTGAGIKKSEDTSLPTSTVQNIPLAYQKSSNPEPYADGKTAAVHDVTKSLLQTPLGDMVNVKLRIIGDPTFIKQDDVFDTQGLYATTRTLVNDSIYFDGGELYVWINFRAPTDYNENTGLADPRVGDYTYNPFNGKYTVIQVDNNFQQGKFEQTLNLVRLAIQPDEARRLQQQKTQNNPERLPSTGSTVPPGTLTI
jgi:hypothetical protein